MKLFGNCYAGRRVLVTGHTGFKGSWLALWLTQLQAEVTGLALDPKTNPNHWDLLQPQVDDRRIDTRDFPAVLRVLEECRPEIVFHLAAQPLVRRSYKDPLETFSTNVMGAANLLEAVRLTNSVRAIVIITSDKVYENQEWPWGYRETDRLGGHDPYSASKSASEIVAESYRKSFFSAADAPLLATVRAGNVVGGGDWSEDRLIPDLVRAVKQGRPLEIRSPNATRPWQHVLECLSGYLMVGQKLLEQKREFASSWNFGPEHGDNRKVIEVLQAIKDNWSGFDWHVGTAPQLHEANLLYLDNAKAKTKLGWRPVWNLSDTLRATANWYQAFLDHALVETQSQLAQYITDAQRLGCVWVEN